MNKTKDWYKAQAAKGAAQNRPALEAFTANIDALVAQAHIIASGGERVLSGEAFGTSELGRHLSDQLEGVFVEARVSVESHCEIHGAAQFKLLKGLAGSEWDAYFSQVQRLTSLPEQLYPTTE